MQRPRRAAAVSEHHSTHLLRADWELAKPASAKIEAALIKHALALLPRADAVVLSDYAKGVLTPRLIRTVIERARRLKKPVIVDPKGNDFSIYRGATVITPNRKELGDATRLAVGTVDELAAAASALTHAVGSKAVVVTLSEEGACCKHEATRQCMWAYSVKVRDVSGGRHGRGCACPHACARG
jgi:D-beta-D-heptose 7-phosphate kinase/D-beta-D-heptose 1-phosphate adenosyltransferase